MGNMSAISQRAPARENSNKMTHLSKNFVEKRTTLLSGYPDEWEVGGKQGYKLEFKMCQLQNLAYDFKWGEESGPLPRHVGITETPSKVLVLDVSLNELVVLDYEGLAPTYHLRHLDASLNRIENYKGVEVLQALHSLNLSNNFIRGLDPGLGRCKALAILDVSMNHIEDITYMPPLSNLLVLHLNNNKIRSLDGIQSLSHLKELYVQRNYIFDIVPLSSSRRLAVLNAADNNIHSLKSTVEVLKGLPKVTSITFHGNPMEKEPGYNSQLLNHPTVNVLDNVNTKPLPKYTGNRPQNPNLVTIKDAAKQAFYDAILERKSVMEENVRFLQERIRNVQKEFSEWEDGMQRDMDATVRHLDSLNSDDLVRYDPEWIRDGFRKTPTHSKPWETLPYIPLRDNPNTNKYWDPKAAPTDPKPGAPIDPRKYDPERSNSRDKRDYTGIKTPDEVLRHVYNELAQQQADRPSRLGGSPYIH